MELWDVGSSLVPQSPAGLAAGALRGIQSRMAQHARLRGCNTHVVVIFPLLQYLSLTILFFS